MKESNPMSKHTDRAVRAAKHINKRQAVVFGRDTWDEDELADLIDRETGLPGLEACIDHLEAEKTKLWEILALVTYRLKRWKVGAKWNDDPDLPDDDVLNDAQTTVKEWRPSRRAERRKVDDEVV